jgi:23S rRNA U2552 (ribose-2'-O)-methylase RlmE/FtsJ
MRDNISLANVQEVYNIKDQTSEDKCDLFIEGQIEINYHLETPKEKYGYNSLLNEQRNKIDKISSEVWKKVRWYINDYDFLVKDPIINRAFYKYWEIVNRFDMFDKFDINSDIIFHCAEAPGGFIQGSNIYLQLNNNCVSTQSKESIIDEDGFTKMLSKKQPRKKYKIFTISLNKNLSKYKAYNLPSYNDSIINKHIYITYGKDDTGDINNLENIDFIKQRAKLQNSDGFYLITADGGFDEGTDFNNKEQLHYFLILNEIYSAIALQKVGGSFILKVFDIFTDTSIELLYLLNLLYNEVYIYKPKTSRPTNSEKYVVCKGFNCNSETVDFIKNKIRKLSETLKKKNGSGTSTVPNFATFKLFKEIPETFISKIYNMNNLLLNRQCYYLDKAIILCEDSTFIQNYDTELKVSLENRKAVFKQWEIEYSLNGFV